MSALAISISIDGRVVVSNRLMKIESNSESFGSVIRRTYDTDLTNSVIKCSKLNCPTEYEVLQTDEVGILDSFPGFNQVCVTISNAKNSNIPDKNTEEAPLGDTPNVFNLMMDKSRIKWAHPVRLDNGENCKDQLHNHFLESLEHCDICLNFPSIMGEQEITRSLRNITNALWYLDGRKNFKNMTLKTELPERFAVGRFDGFHDWKKAKHKPRHDRHTAKTLSSNLWSLISKPWVSSWNSGLVKDLETLAVVLQEISEFLEKKTMEVQNVHHSLHPVRQISENAVVTHHTAVRPVSSMYISLDTAVRELSDYEPVALEDLQTHLSSSAADIHRFVTGIGLSVSVDILRYNPGGGTGSIVFLWRVPASRSENEILTMSARMLQKLKPNIPIYHTRAMRKAFSQQMSKIAADIPAHVLRQIYKQLTLDSSADQNPALDERVRLALTAEEPDMILDLRHLNPGRPSGTFEVFYKKLEGIIEEWTAADERRHGVAHMSQFLSVPDMIQQVKATLPPDTPIPSETSVLLSFSPPNTCSLTARHYTGRINLTHKIQTRQLRNFHQDFHFCAAQFKYMRQMAIKFRHRSVLISADDKAKVCIGEPDMPVSTGVRGKKSLAPVNINLSALDHDQNQKGKLVPSVMLDITIPEEITQSFYQGQVSITLKDAVFQSSTPNRFAAELVKYWDSLSDEKKSQTDIIFLVTDGGPEHRMTFDSVKISLAYVFQKTGVEMLVAIRNAPGQSFLNPVEPVMSVINIALQNVALVRDPIPDGGEDLLKKCSSMDEIRKRVPEASWAKCIDSAMQIVEERCKRCTLKKIPFQLLPAASAIEMKAVEDNMKKIDPTLEAGKLQKSQVAHKEKYQQFLVKHARFRHYSFQLRKCDDPGCCPGVRSPLQWLPDPVLDSTSSHYKAFEDVYGTTTNDNDRGTIKFSTFAKENQGCEARMLVGQNVRFVTRCAECNKPRCIYSTKELTTRQMTSLKRIFSQHEYICGSIATPENHPLEGQVFSRVGISCASPLEWAFYASKLGASSICCHCGQLDGETDRDLAKKYKTVLPTCVTCRNKGRSPLHRGPLASTRKRHADD